MNNYLISATFTKHVFLITALLFTGSVLAQYNTSYNGNSIPVNSGSYNTIFGLFSFGSNTSGAYNTGIGNSVLSFNTTGISNTASGYAALYFNTIGSYNTANGTHALYSNTNGFYNTANGYYALSSNTTGSYNTANGILALSANTIGYNNTANGILALNSNTTGNYNTANGSYALRSNTTGSNNTSTGFYALYYNTTGNRNIAFGDSSGFNSLGNGNVFIGVKSGFYETGSNKIYIANDSNKTILYGDFSTGQILLGKGSATGYVFKGTRTLNVLGGIISDSIRLAPATGWADKVFDKNYKLPSLDQIQKYISANKHLPGIPTAGDVQNNGVNVGEIETKLLQKVEELTLYVLQLKKENEQQQQEINKLKGHRINK